MPLLLLRQRDKRHNVPLSSHAFDGTLDMNFSSLSDREHTPRVYNSHIIAVSQMCVIEAATQAELP
jgi:hypothetical protein